jgi:phage FluMu protein Com
MDNIRCTQCGAIGLETGFIEDPGTNGARGYSRWVAGPLELGAFGFAKLRGRTRWQIDAFRCPNCAHLELFATRRA